MKKRWLIPIAAMILILLGGVLLTQSSLLTSSPPAGRRPFRDLTAADLTSATVTLTPPDKTLAVTDLDALARCLSDVVIYQEDDSITEYAGQGVTFRLTLADGGQTSVTAFNPFLVVDGVGYRTEYEPCEALNSYANELLSSGAAPVVLDGPPWLGVVSGGTTMGAVTGTCSWACPQADGTVRAVEADSPHPLDCRDLLYPLDTAQDTAELNFGHDPDAILSLRRWSDACWGQTGASPEEVPLDGLTFSLSPGGWVYEVTARWDDRGWGGGTASYCFYIDRLE